MVRNYRKKTNQGSWSAAAMEQALREVNNDTLSIREAAEVFDVPREALRRRVEASKTGQTMPAKPKLGRFTTVLTTELENLLVEHIISMQNRLFGLNTLDIRRLAYQLAIRNGIPNNFNHERQLAGESWLAGFRKRHPEISLRSPEKTSVARARCFNKVNTQQFYKMMEEVCGGGKFTANRIYNVDETPLTTVQDRSTKVFAVKGKKQVGTLSSAERGTLITAVVCMSATGHYVPPLLIFPRVRMKDELKIGAPPGTIFRAHPSGWVQSDIFLDWFTHFLEYTKPTKEDPVLLILDGHRAHTKNLDFLQMAEKRHVTVVSLPPHCTHRMQPLDVAFMAPLKNYYSKAIEKFLRSSKGQPVRQINISALFGEAYSNAAQVSTAENGFRCCGIYPLDPNVFTDEDFSAAEVTNVPMPPIEITSSTVEGNASESDSEFLGFGEEDLRGRDAPATVGQSVLHGSSKLKRRILPNDIMPLPLVDIPRDAPKRGRKAEKAAILTSPEYLRDLRSQKEKKENVEKRSTSSKPPTKTAKKAVEKRNKRKIKNIR